MRSKHMGPIKGLVAAAFLSLGLGSPAAQNAPMSFFVTSVGLDQGADLGGLAGADAHCQTLAAQVGAGDRLWRAYLSTTAANGGEIVHARDRIGAGPWFNVNGVLIAADVEQLHAENNIDADTALNEQGGSFTLHDILTGSQEDGTAFPDGEDTTCQNWTSSASGAGSAQVGHHNRRGLNLPGVDPTSWNSSHLSTGCSQNDLANTGGAGYFYCFAAQTAAETAVERSYWGRLKGLFGVGQGE